MTQCSSSAAQCPDGQSLGPANCGCAFSYNGKMIFMAPFFTDVTTGEPFLQLETSLSTQLDLRLGSVYLSNVHWNENKYLQVQVKLFPSSGMAFNLVATGNFSEENKLGEGAFGPVYKTLQDNKILTGSKDSRSLKGSGEGFFIFMKIQGTRSSTVI
uniref:Protein kinase domain-containing protein n=1 Tax=Leersia perrieri TaxID=77586 RepID=A0A0D9WHX1_9ORYZ